ncbi:MAG: SagB/ThcOx family dehydrogenase [Thermodesulfobacteriota bacterium]
MSDVFRFVIEQQAGKDMDSDWEDFQEKIKLNPCTAVKLGMRINSIRNSPFLQQALCRSYKSYPNLPQVLLPEARLDLGRPLEDIIRRRRSLRQYGPGECKAQELANVLQLSYGISGTAVFPEQQVMQYLRTIPSAGALYPLEIYPCVFKADDIASGLYHYRVARNSLELLKCGDIRDDLKKCGDWTGVDIDGCAFVILISAVSERSTYKYGNRGYRFVLLEVGFVSIIMDLIANSMDMGACHLGGFYDDFLNRFIGLNGVTESVQTVLSFGRSCRGKEKLCEGSGDPDERNSEGCGEKQVQSGKTCEGSR